MATFRIRKDGVFYRVCLAGSHMSGDMPIHGLVALTQEDAEVKLKAAELVWEARKIVGKINDMPADVVREAYEDLAKINDALYNKAWNDEMATLIEYDVTLDNRLFRAVRFWKL